MTRRPTVSGPSQRQSDGGSSCPDTSLAAKKKTSLPPPEIVSGAKLGEFFDLSERPIREYRGRGVVVREGNGYNLKRSVVGMLDHYRVEGLRKRLGDTPFVQDLEDCLAYRRQLSVRRDRLEAGIAAVLAMPELPEAARATLAPLIEEEPDDGAS
jgi:hypothetical protein